MKGYQNRIKPSVDDTASKNDADAQIMQITSNPLHEYATYTYGLTLYMLSADEYERLQALSTENLATWNPSTVLISSAGKFNSTETTLGRHPKFTDDFYFDDLKLTTVIGLNNRTRGTNAIEFSFTIVEPYGLTLLDRLIIAANGPAINSQNYLDQPYLLELEFYGTTDLGETTKPLSALKKRFPIKIADFKIRAEAKGSTYTVKAYPYNHAAFNEIAVSTPVTLSVSASNLGNFFESTSISTVREEKQAREKKLKEATTAVESMNGETASVRAAAREALVNAQVEYNKPYNVRSYADALNVWSKSLLGSEASEADEVEFKFVGFPNNIESSSIVPDKMPKGTLASTTTYKTAAQDANPTISQQTPVDATNVHNTTINAGTSIIDVINIAMRNSEYIRRQVIDSTTGFRDNVPVDFYKVIPQITKLKYDSKRKRYATKTVYHIVYYRYFNAKHPNLPYTNPSASVKKYDYFYTGKNLDVIDFSIDFNVSYFNATVALPGNYDAGNSQLANPTGNDSIKNRAVVGSKDSIGQYKTEATANNGQNSSSNIPDGKAALVTSAISSIYSGPRGDLVEVKLKIIGDPDFIKQDDMYVNPGMPGYLANTVNSNGSIAMDFSEVFFDLTFNSPVDMDESTGLLRADSEFFESKFSGTYKLLTVSNELVRGQFIQNLTAVRMMDVTQATAPLTARQVDNQLDKAKAASDADQMLARVPTKDTARLGSLAAHANLGKMPTATQYQAKIQAAKDAGADAAEVAKAASRQAFANGDINPVTMFPTAAVKARIAAEKTELEISKDIGAQIKRTITGGR